MLTTTYEFLRIRCRAPSKGGRTTGPDRNSSYQDARPRSSRLLTPPRLRQLRLVTISDSRYTKEIDLPRFLGGRGAAPTTQR